MPARSPSLLFRVGSALAFVVVLAGCTQGGQFDPTEIFNNDAFDTKKKLKGDRAAVFPDGVPGTTTGVPADLVKGYQAPPEPADTATAAPAPATAAAAPAPKPKPKPKPKLAVAPAKKQQDSAWGQQPAPRPAPAASRITVGPTPSSGGQQQGATFDSIWPTLPPATPAQQTPAPASQTAQPSQSVWPNPPAPGKSSQ